MVRDKNAAKQVVVECGPVPDVFVTNMLPIEHGNQFIRLTFCAQHTFGRENGTEMHIVLRVAMTMAAYAEMLQQVMGASGVH